MRDYYSIEERTRIVNNKNNSLEDLIAYREMLNIGSRALKGKIKAFYYDIKIALWAWSLNKKVSYEKRDNHTVIVESKKH